MTLNVCALFAMGCTALGQVPTLINYQGKLLNGSNLINGQIGLDLQLFDAESGGSLLYADSNVVDVVDGLYSTFLGDNTYSGNLKAAFTSQEVWIEIHVNGTALKPRERIASVAYSIKAQGVSTGAITSAMIAHGAVGSVQLANNAVNSNNIAFGAIHSENIAFGAIGSPQIANGAVTIAKIGSDAVGRLQLIKGYESGRLNMELLARTNIYDFSRAVTQTTITFAIDFASEPIVTFGVTTTNRVFAAENGAAVIDRNTNHFIVGIEYTHETVGFLEFTSLGYAKPALALVNGRPAAALALRYSNTIHYVRAADPFGIEWNNPMTVVSDADNLYSCLSMSVIGGRPAICYRDTNDVLRYLRALDVNGTNWGDSVVVDSDSGGGQNSSLLEVDGHPAIAYQNGTFNELRYAYSDTVAGTNAIDWNVVTVDSNGDPGEYLSMAVIDENPAIAYYEDVSNDLWYARALNTQGSVWDTPQLIVPDDDSGVGVALAEIGGRPAVVFRLYLSGATNVLFYYRAFDSVGSSWGDAAFVNTAAVDAALCQLGTFGGYPAVCYYDGDNSDLVLVRSPSTNGVDSFWWDAPITLATNGATGIFPQMAEIHGTPAILYINKDGTRYEYIRSGNPPANSWLDWIAVEP